MAASCVASRTFSAAAAVRCRGYSLGLQRLLTDFGADHSFAQAVAKVKEHYLIEVQTRKPGGEVRGQAKIEGIAKECLAFVIGKGHDDQVKDLRPNPIRESGAQMLKKVQSLLTRPDSAVYLVE